MVLETDKSLKVVVFDSAVEGILTHYDFLAKLEDLTSLAPGPTRRQQLPDMLVRISRAPVVSITVIRERATGVGANSRWLATCGSPAPRRLSCRGGKSAPPWCPAADYADMLLSARRYQFGGHLEKAPEKQAA